jgi:LCP family protein required for cell wall assembly
MAHFPPPGQPPGVPPSPFPRGGPAPPIAPPSYGEERHPKRWWLAVPVALAVYLFLFLVTLVQPVQVAGLSLAVPVPGLPPERIFGLPDRPFTVMIVGLDIRPTQDGPSRTDSILLLRVDGDRNRAGIVSVPRDTMMRVPLDGGDATTDRVNTAFVYNWTADDPDRAPAALAATIEENLGIKVDYHIVFDQRGAADIIDAAGGVNVVVREAFGQDNYSDDDVNVVPQFFPEGRQHLDGYQAVAYGRIREGTSDFDRIRRQQQVAEGLVEQLSAPRHVFRLPGVWGAYNDGVETDLSRRQTAGLFVLLKRIGTDRLVTRSLGDAAVSCVSCPAALVQLVPDEAARIISEAFDDDEAGQAAAQLLLAAGVTP